MDAGVIELARPRWGHFELGTGYHGDVWLDLDALFLRPALLQPHVEWLAGRLREHQVDAVCGPLEGGAFLALALATRLGVAFLPGYRAPARPAATAPADPPAAAPARLGAAAPAGPGAAAPAGSGATAQAGPGAAAPVGPGGGPAVGYRLPAVPGGIGGWRVAIADDAVNAGTAVRACAAELHQRGAGPAAVAALLALGPAHATVKRTLALPLYAAGQLDSQAWPASTCPLCASGAPLTDPE